MSMATKRTNPRRDFTQVAFDVVQRATGEAHTLGSVPASVAAKKSEPVPAKTGATKKKA